MRTSNQKSAYFSKLTNIEIITPPEVVLFQNLLTSTKFCSKLNCWQDAAFSFNETTLTLNALENQVKLQEKIFISCSLNFKYSLVSVYHAAMGEITEGIFKPDDDSLPEVELSKLEAGEVTLTRKPHLHKFLQTFWPIYYQDKVSFTCKDTTAIKINGLDQKCNSAIHFQVRPQSLQIKDGEDIWTHTSANSTTFFLKSLDWDFNDWPKAIQKVNLWTKEPSDPHIFDVISEHLKAMSPIESGLWASLGAVCLITIMSIPWFCYCFCPGALKSCLPACCSSCLIRQVNERIFTQRELRLALALMKASNEPSAPTLEQESLPLNPLNPVATNPVQD